MKKLFLSLVALLFLTAATPSSSKAIVYPEFPITKKYMIAFRGLGSALDEESLSDWCDRNNYVLKVYDYTQDEAALRYAMSIKSVHLEILGFSKGAETAYDLADDLGAAKKIKRMITVGSYHTVTTSFATKRRPPLPNVKEHWNFIETFQQPENFNVNPINVSLGNVAHLQSVKAALNLIDENSKYQ